MERWKGVREDGEKGREEMGRKVTKVREKEEGEKSMGVVEGRRGD